MPSPSREKRSAAPSTSCAGQTCSAGDEVAIVGMGFLGTAVARSAPARSARDAGPPGGRAAKASSNA